MKILHYNIHMWLDAEGSSNMERVGDLIAQESPDVVSLVEVDEPWAHPNGLCRLAEKLGYNWAFIPAFEYRGQGGFGNALLSRQPLKSVQQWQLLSPRLYDGTEPSEPRAVVLACIEVEGHALTIGATHFPRHDEQMRRDASRRLIDLIADLPKPWIICGDFNQPPSAWLNESHTVAPNPPVATYPTTEPVETIDYCVIAGLQGQATTLATASASDHLPILLTAEPS